MIVNGVEWLTGEEIREQLGDDVTDEMLWDWKRRKLVIAQRVGRFNYYRLDSGLDAELATRDKTRPRRAGLQAAS